MGLEITGKGREALYLKGTREEVMKVLLSDPSLAPKKLGHDCVTFWTNIRATYLGSPDNAAVMYTSNQMAPIRSRMAAVRLTGEATDLLAPLDLGRHRGAGDLVMAAEIAQLYSMGKSDITICKNLATLPPNQRQKVVVFLAGMLGQDLADRLRGILKVGRVFQHDLRRAVQQQLIRYTASPEVIPGLLILLGEYLSPVENVAIHLALGYANAS